MRLPELDTETDNEGYLIEKCPTCGKTKRVTLLGCEIKVSLEMDKDEWKLIKFGNFDDYQYDK